MLFLVSCFLLKVSREGDRCHVGYFLSFQHNPQPEDYSSLSIVLPFLAFLHNFCLHYCFTTHLSLKSLLVLSLGRQSTDMFEQNDSLLLITLYRLLQFSMFDLTCYLSYLTFGNCIRNPNLSSQSCAHILRKQPIAAWLMKSSSCCQEALDYSDCLNPTVRTSLSKCDKAHKAGRVGEVTEFELTYNDCRFS